MKRLTHHSDGMGELRMTTPRIHLGNPVMEKLTAIVRDWPDKVVFTDGKTAIVVDFGTVDIYREPS